MRWGVLLMPALLAACSGGAPNGQNMAAGNDATRNAAAVPMDVKSADMNAAEIVPNDEGGTDEDPGATPQ